MPRIVKQGGVWFIIVKNKNSCKKKYLSHFQKSVFRGEMNPSKLIRFKTDLNKVIDKNEDFICIIKLMNGNVFGEEVLGSKGNNTGEDLII